MGSNQSKQPNGADRGANVWSRDEQRENRQRKRSSRNHDAIEDSVKSTESRPSCAIDEMDKEAVDEPTWQEPSKKRKKGNRKWCRRKEGREHEYELKRVHRLFSWFPEIYEYYCKKCGKVNNFRKKL